MIIAKYIIFYSLFTLIVIISLIILILNSDSNSKHTCPKRYKLLASGSSDNHFHLLLLFIYRIFISENNFCIIIWDLGISTNNLLLLEAAKIFIERKNFYLKVMKFNYSNFPKHFNININAGCYSWKPFVIWDTYTIYKKNLLWLDCGCYILGRLDYEYNVIKNKEIYTINATHSIKKFTHNSLLALLDVKEKYYNKTMCSAGILGISYYSSKVEYIFNLWKACALIKNCIAPKGSYKGNHLQDQSVLSILLYQNNVSFSNNKRLGFSLHFDEKYNKYNDSLYFNFLKYIRKHSSI